MSTGHDVDTSGRTFSNRNWVMAFLSLLRHEPGTHSSIHRRDYMLPRYHSN